jgi:hypothetical protein
MRYWMGNSQRPLVHGTPLQHWPLLEQSWP